VARSLKSRNDSRTGFLIFQAKTPSSSTQEMCVSTSRAPSCRRSEATNVVAAALQGRGGRDSSAPSCGQRRGPRLSQLKPHDAACRLSHPRMGRAGYHRDTHRDDTIIGMSQLSPHDATFLYSDTTNSNANVTLIHIYNQSTAPGGTVRFKTILAHIASRLDRLPVLRQKLRRVPLDLDYPYWVDDEHFDLEYHVRHIALPKPGDWRQFCIQASRIHARPLDLNRPLWEIYVIEGLDGFLDLPVGSFALLTKMHTRRSTSRTAIRSRRCCMTSAPHRRRPRRQRRGLPTGRRAWCRWWPAAWPIPWAARRAWPGRWAAPCGVRRRPR